MIRDLLGSDFEIESPLGLLSFLSIYPSDCAPLRYSFSEVNFHEPDGL